MARPEEKLKYTKEAYVEDVGIQQIKSIRFSMFSSNEIRKSAEVQVYKGKIYGEDSKPMKNGLIDTRMGATNKRGECSTCFIWSMRDPTSGEAPSSLLHPLLHPGSEHSYESLGNIQVHHSCSL